MAGIFDRVGPDIEDNIPTHPLWAAFVLVATGDLTKPQARDLLNDMIVAPLSSAAETDLNNMLTNAETGNVAARVAYGIKVHAVLTLYEGGTSVLTESLVRSILGI